MKISVRVFLVFLVGILSQQSLAGRFRTVGRNGGNDTVPSACLENCEAVMADNMDSEYPFALDSDTLMAVHPFSTVAYCRVYGEAKSCVQKCPADDAGQLKENHMEKEYICSQSNFTGYVSCYCQVQNATWSQCTTQSKCGKYVMEPPEDDVENLKLQCSKWKCGLDCMKQSVVSKCGQAAFDTLTTATMKRAEKFRARAGSPEAPECDTLTG